jgi:hypothetical protein
VLDEQKTAALGELAEGADESALSYDGLFKTVVQHYLEEVQGLKFIGDAAIRFLQGSNKKPATMTPAKFFRRRAMILGFVTGGYSCPFRRMCSSTRLRFSPVLASGKKSTPRRTTRCRPTRRSSSRPFPRITPLIFALELSRSSRRRRKRRRRRPPRPRLLTKIIVVVADAPDVVAVPVTIVVTIETIVVTSAIATIAVTNVMARRVSTTSRATRSSPTSVRPVKRPIMSTRNVTALARRGEPLQKPRFVQIQ